MLGRVSRNSLIRSGLRYKVTSLQIRTYSGQGPSVKVLPDRLEFKWSDGRSTTFDNHFLYDHCRCPRCFHPITKQRLKTLSKISSEIAPRSVNTTNADIFLEWQDGHESRFPLSFLEKAAYDPPLSTTSNRKKHRILWTSNIAENPPSVTLESLESTNRREESAAQGLLHALEKLESYGFCFITGVEPTPEATERVIRKISHIRETHYGGFWDFTSDMSKGDLAYSSEALPAHTDTTYFTDPAGLQIFHCLSHPPPGSGGETLLVDGFQAASKLEKSSYAVLSRMGIPAHASGTPGSLLRPLATEPVFRHDQFGQLLQVRWNNEDRGVLGQGWTGEQLREWYKAAKQYDEIVTNRESEYWVKLTPGTMVVIDNWRVMHGRSGFTGARRMCGAYIGADDWRSKLAALRQRFYNSNEADIWASGW